jgi:hypothetical protein
VLQGAGDVLTPPATPKKAKAAAKPRAKKSKAKVVDEDHSPTNDWNSEQEVKVEQAFETEM